MSARRQKQKNQNPPGALSFSVLGGNDFGDVEDLLAFLFPNSHKRISPSDSFILAKWEGKPVGFSHIQPGKKSVCIRGIGVLGDFRKKGIASRLLMLTIDFCARSHPGMPVWLMVKPHNSDALKLYLKHGFMLEKNLGGSYRLRLSAPT